MLAFVSLTRSEWALACTIAGSGHEGIAPQPSQETEQRAHRSHLMTIPMTGHDISLDLFTTPDQLMSGQRPFARPPG